MSSDVVRLERGTRLRVSHFFEGSPHWDCFSGIDVHRAYFGFSRRRHYVADDLCDVQDRAVVGGENAVVREEKMAASAAAGFGLA